MLSKKMIRSIQNVFFEFFTGTKSLKINLDVLNRLEKIQQELNNSFKTNLDNIRWDLVNINTNIENLQAQETSTTQVLIFDLNKIFFIFVCLKSLGKQQFKRKKSANVEKKRQ